MGRGSRPQSILELVAVGPPLPVPCGCPKPLSWDTLVQKDEYTDPYSIAVCTYFKQLGMCVICASRYNWKVKLDDTSVYDGGSIQIEGGPLLKWEAEH